MDQINEQNETHDVVILGAGLAGMSAAHKLRDQDTLVLEERDRVGGRTFSGGDEGAWFNVGAQLLSSPKVIELARELDLELISAREADFGFIVNGRFARGSSPERLLLGINMTLAQKVDFGLTSLRLRRKLHAVEGMSPEARSKLDQSSLQEVIGRASPVTQRLLSECCESASGLPAPGASGLFGLVYGLGAFLDPASKEYLFGVRGGTQRIALTIADQLPDGTVRLGCRVQEVRPVDGSIAVRYTDAIGTDRVVTAKECICAMPAGAVLKTFPDLPAEKREAVQRLTPYSTLISIAWPVADGRSRPWDGVFVCPVSGREGFGLLTNYGFLAQQKDPSVGGFLNTLAAGTKAEQFDETDDDALVARLYGELCAIFPEARSLVDRDGAVVQRWQQGGLPPARPGYLSRRDALRSPIEKVQFCGDYTSEPGLPGAFGSGSYAARTALERLRSGNG